MPPPPCSLTRRVTLDNYPFLTQFRKSASLRDGVAIVTGAGRGIGKAIALAFVEAGSKVAFVARTTREVEEATAEARQRFPSSSVVAITADVTKVADNARLLQETEKALGPVSTIVCAAGTNWFEPFVLSDDESWWQQVTLNLKAPADLTRLALPGMIERKNGRIVYVSSIAACASLPYTTGYNVSKGGLNRLASTLQAETQLKNPSTALRFFTMHPGEVHTALHDQPLRPRVVAEAPEVGQLLERLHASNPGYSADLAAWTSVWLAAGGGDAMGGRFFDATRDLGELMERLPEVLEKNLYELSVPFLN